MRNKKILIVSSYTPPLNAGGGRNAYNFGKYLSKKGYRVTLLSFNRKGRLKRKENVDGLIIFRLFYLNHNYITKIISLSYFIPSFFLKIISNDIIFIIGGNIIAFELIILIGSFLKKKVVFRSTMVGEDDLISLTSNKIYGSLKKIIFSKISYYFSINPTFTEAWMRVYNTKNNIIESIQGVDTSIFFPVTHTQKNKFRAKLGLPLNIIIIISVGYLIKRKGFKEIFEALNNINFPFLYVIVGDYHVSKDHYSIKSNNQMLELFSFGKNILKDKVLFVGSKNNIDEYLKASDIFILNSDKEGFPPNSVLESMACGIPTVFKKIAGTEIFLKYNKEIILFTSGDSSEIVSSLKKLYFDNSFRKMIGENASEFIQKNASFDAVLEKLKMYLNM